MIAILMTEMASWRSTEYEWSNLRLKFPEAAEKVPRKASALRLPLVCHGSLGPERDDRADVELILGSRERSRSEVRMSQQIQRPPRLGRDSNRAFVTATTWRQL